MLLSVLECSALRRLSLTLNAVESNLCAVVYQPVLLAYYAALNSTNAYASSAFAPSSQLPSTVYACRNSAQHTFQFLCLLTRQLLSISIIYVFFYYSSSSFNLSYFLVKNCISQCILNLLLSTLIPTREQLVSVQILSLKLVSLFLSSIY